MYSASVHKCARFRLRSSHLPSSLPLSAFVLLSFRPFSSRGPCSTRTRSCLPQPEPSSALVEDRLSFTDRFLSALLLLTVAFWPFGETGRREWRVRTEFFLHHPLICFEVLPNAALLISELLPPLEDSAGTRGHVSPPLPKAFVPTSAPFRIVFKWIVRVLPWLRGCYTARLSTCGQQALLSIDGRLCEFILVVSSAAYKGLLSTRTDWPLFLAFLS